MNDFENRLRAELAEQARRAPDGDRLAERIITGLDGADRPGRADVTPLHRNRQWRTWTFPLIAAAAVAAVALAVVGVNHFGRTPDRSVADQNSTHPTGTSSPSTPAPPSPTSTTPGPTLATQDVIPLLNNVRVLDLTFVSNDDGWALATADCLSPQARTPLCTAMLHTTNGGTTWRGMPTPPANVPIGSSCAAPCVQHIRFANDHIGYAYGLSTLFMTTDGGTNWTLESGGADALETLDGNVIRVVHAGAGCPPGCSYSVQTAPIGSVSWHPVSLPGSGALGMSVGVSLTRTGSAAYLAVFGHTSGGASDARTSLYRSSDKGASWTNSGEPCPSSGANEVDSTQLTSGSDASVTVLCTPRGAAGGEFTATAYGNRSTFQAASRTALAAAHATAATAIGSATGSILVVADGTGVFRSTDGGSSFTALTGPAGSIPAGASWIGFESATAGRAVSADGRTIWTTQDAGASWQAHSFG